MFGCSSWIAVGIGNGNTALAGVVMIWLTQSFQPVIGDLRWWGQTQSLTFTDSGHYDITLSVTDTDGITTSHQETVIIKAPVTHDNPNETGHFAQIAFENLQDTYEVGETVVIALIETLPRSQTEHVDLWIAVQLPSGELLFRTDNPLMPWHPKQQPYKTGIDHTETHHDVFDFEVPEGMGGDYFLYAVYVKTCENPISNDLSHRSNLADKKITLVNH